MSLPQLQRSCANFHEQCEICKKLVKFLVRKKSNAVEGDRSCRVSGKRKRKESEVVKVGSNEGESSPVAKTSHQLLRAM